MRPRRPAGWWCWLACCALLLGGAGDARPVNFAQLPGWPGENPAAALPPLLKSCAAPRTGPAAARWAAACAAAVALPARPDAATARAFLERHFRPHALGTGMLTGYYEPELRGSLRRGGAFQVPLHALPPNGPLRRLDRAAIERGGARRPRAGTGFGSMTRSMPSSCRSRAPAGWCCRMAACFGVGYAGAERPCLPRHRPRALVERGAITQGGVSHAGDPRLARGRIPAEAAALMRENPSFIFFRPLPDWRRTTGPLGAQGVPLTPGRVAGGRPAFLPLGVPVWLASRRPLADGKPLRRLVVAQDTGGAIRGPVRGRSVLGLRAPPRTPCGPAS